MSVSKELKQRRAIIRERERLFALRYVDSRPIRWKEASSLIVQKNLTVYDSKCFFDFTGTIPDGGTTEPLHSLS